MSYLCLKLLIFCIVCPQVDHSMAFCYGWSLYGFYMDINLTSYGISMAYLKWRSLYGHRMAVMCLKYGLYVVNLWLSYGLYMDKL